MCPGNHDPASDSAGSAMRSGTHADSAGSTTGSSAGSAMRSGSGGQTAGSELAARQTGLAFQRTRLSAERTLMSVIRTSLAMIGFGFTLYQVFNELYRRDIIHRSHAARNFGVALALIGVTLLVAGSTYHVFFMRGLRRLREDLADETLIHAESGFPVSYTLITAALLLLIGLFTILSMTLSIGPFG